MAQFFVEEQNYPDNAGRKNFIFLAYPFTPPISQDDYNAVVKELQPDKGSSFVFKTRKRLPVVDIAP